MSTAKNVKSLALEIGPSQFKMKSMGLARFERRNFEQLLAYKLKENSELRFNDFNKHCGISRQQWDIFKSENREKNVKWVVA